MLLPSTQRFIRRITPFGVIWLVTGLVFLIVEQAATFDSVANSTSIAMSPVVFVFSSIAITMVGFIVGFIELRYFEMWFVKKSFPKKMFSKVLLYAFLFAIITVLTYPLAASLELNTHLFDDRVWQKFKDYIFSVTNLSTIIQLGVALLLSLLYSEISENTGRGILLNFFTGKYHQPREEFRVFMFLDMKSSTTIAEKLGHAEYFKLLKEYYFDLSAPIVDHFGEIYQYVGDEIVISWNMKSSNSEPHCIRCFFALKKTLKKRNEWYISRFGVAPEFKAGLHFGKVTTGEIGALKKEIIFTGDVLNTTARIQELCNSLDEELLISGELLSVIPIQTEFQPELKGVYTLRGKQKDLTLYTLPNVR